MKNNSQLLILLLFETTILTNCSNKNKLGTKVVFPEISTPIQIAKDGKEHLFASYYGINSFSKSQKYVTVLELRLANNILRY
jgi:hypothetical protein